MHIISDRVSTISEKAYVQRNITQLESIVEMEVTNSLSISRGCLACSLVAIDKASEARLMLRTTVASAFDMISDEIENTNFQGYYNLACILLYVGDVHNALSALSLISPLPHATDVIFWVLDFDTEPEKALSQKIIAHIAENPSFTTFQVQMDEARRQLSKDFESPGGYAKDNDAELFYKNNAMKEKLAHCIQRKRLEEFWRFRCKGGCGRAWDSENTMNFCTLCYNTGFCDACLEALKAGGLKTRGLRAHTCDLTHKWLRLGALEKEDCLAVLQGYVVVGGKLEDGLRRVGGYAIPVSIWLDGLTREWGYSDETASEWSQSGDGSMHWAEEKIAFWW